MPWSGNHLPWSLSEILFHVPGTSGVYAIWRDDMVVYVGETNDLQRRLLEHFKGSNRPLSGLSYLRLGPVWLDTSHSFVR